MAAEKAVRGGQGTPVRWSALSRARAVAWLVKPRTGGTSPEDEQTIGSRRASVAAPCMGRNFLVFEPVANLELNVARHVRLATGVGYRFAVAGSGPGPSSDGMRSLVARTSIIFGSF